MASVPISPANNRLLRAHFRLVGVPLLCLTVITCGGDGGGPNQTGAINISPNVIAFATVPGGSPDPKTVGITPATVDLTGLTATVSFLGTPPSPWLEASLGSSEATLASPAILTLQVTNSTLPAGTYKASVTVQSPTAANAPKVNVTLTIEAAAALAIVTQPSPTAASGAALADAPVVQLQTADGDPVGQSGVDVSVALEGEGSLGGPATSTTDAQGRATFEGLSVTALIGEHTLLFTAPGLTEVRSSPIAITVGAAARIAASSVISQLAEAGTPVNEPPVALVTDEAGNPVEGVAVKFEVSQGGGIIDPTTTAVTTDGNGLAASTSWTLGGIAGDNAATATSDGLQGSPVGFTATGTNGGVVPGPVSGTKSTVAASPASFAAGSAGTTITVTARDANNNLIGGADVTLSSTGTNFVFQNTTLTTGLNGATLGKATTSYTSTKAEAKSISAQITASGLTVSPAAAAVTVVAGAPNAGTSTLTAESPVTGISNGSGVTITVKDANNNPVSGRSVTLSFVGGAAGGQILGPFSTTNSSGVAFASLFSTTGGTYVVQATAGGTTITQTATVKFLVSFRDDIEPLFQQSFVNAGSGGGFTSACSGCHAPYPNVSQEPNLSLDNLAVETHDGDRVVTPGNADDSRLYRSLVHNPNDTELDPSLDWMPPFKQVPGDELLPADVIARIKQWINQNGLNQALTP